MLCSLSHNREFCSISGKCRLSFVMHKAKCAVNFTLKNKKLNFVSVGTLRYLHCCFITLLRCCGGLLLFFLQIGGLWQPHIEQVSGHHLSKNICSLCVSVSDFSDSDRFSNHPPVKKIMTSLKTQMMASIYFFAIMYFWFKVCTLFF